MVFLDRLLERRYCLTHEGCTPFNSKDDTLEHWIVLILVITLPLETHVTLSVNGYQLNEHLGILSIVNFEILESEKLLLVVCLIFKLHEIN